MIREVADFIEADVDDDLLQEIVVQTSFEKMKEGKREGETKELKKFADFFGEGYSMYRKGKTDYLHISRTNKTHEAILLETVSNTSIESFFSQADFIELFFNFHYFLLI